MNTTGAAIVATANPGCHLQIARGLKEAAADVQVVHPVSLLAAAYRRETDHSKESKVAKAVEANR